jgi:hypothetical protein
MAKIVYHISDSYNREASEISFDVPNDMNINEYKIICVRLAHAMGYHYKSIEKVFGNLEYETESDREFKQFIKQITQLTGSLQI